MIASAISTVKQYPIRRPVAAFLAGGSVALLGGLIGLGGAEFRLPLLILVFAVFPHRAVRINLLISLATLATAAIVRLRYIQDTAVAAHVPEMVAMSLAGISAAWFGAGRLSRIPKAKIAPLIAVLLAIVAAFLVGETFLFADGAAILSSDMILRVMAALAAGLAVGAVSSVLGVAGGEFILPILIFLFGADIKTAGTASVLISTPIVLAGVTRHWMTGHFRSQSLLAYLVLPMSVGSIAGAYIGGLLSAWAPTFGLRLALAAILSLSAFKLWTDSKQGRFM